MNERTPSKKRKQGGDASKPELDTSPSSNIHATSPLVEVNGGDSGNLKNRMTKMLACFKYNVKSGDGKEKGEQARKALALYEAIHGNSDNAQKQRRQFLLEFERNGGGKGKDGLKWVVEYTKSACHENKKELAALENFFTRLFVS